MYNVSMIDGHIDKPKFTDNEIKKALECCATRDGCKSCPRSYNGEMCRGDTPTEMILDALDLINRLEAENQRLRAQVRCLKQYDEERDIALHARLIATAKAEAAEEFAEGLKEKACSYDLPNYHSFDAVTVEDIDDFAKEMEKKYDI